MPIPGLQLHGTPESGGWIGCSPPAPPMPPCPMAPPEPPRPASLVVPLDVLDALDVSDGAGAGHAQPTQRRPTITARMRCISLASRHRDNDRAAVCRIADLGDVEPHF